MKDKTFLIIQIILTTVIIAIGVIVTYIALNWDVPYTTGCGI